MKANFWKRPCMKKLITCSKAMYFCAIRGRRTILLLNYSHFSGFCKSNADWRTYQMFCFRARLVSASIMTHLGHSITQTASKIAKRTIRIILVIAHTQSSIPQENLEQFILKERSSLAFCVRVFTKAYLQSGPTECLILYRSPTEAIEDDFVAWKAIKQFYEEVEASRNWISTFVPRLYKNILDFRPSIYDILLLFSESHSASLAVSKDDVLLVLYDLKRSEEKKTAFILTCREWERSLVSFKGVDTIRNEYNIHFSH